MKWTSTNRRIAVAAYLSSIVLVVAHTTNAFVADTLDVPLEHRVASTVVTETVTPVEPPQQLVDTILKSKLFLLPPTTDASSSETVAPQAPPLETAKKVALFGTVMGREGGMMAVLEDLATKRQSLYRLGNQVPNAGTLAGIEKNRVLFREGTQEEWLNLALAQQVGAGAPQVVPPVPARLPAGPHRKVLDRREVTAALEDTTRLLTQAQAVPYLTDGKLDGFRLYNVVPQGFFDKIGLQTNDLLQRINGVDIRDPSVMLSLFQQLRQERTVRVDLVRNAQRQTLLYEIR
ncbi:MAG: type II secretion system protein N [Nitrospirota bacterium]|nr:type II secretion system protein N [Nitrospirota bacterium]MDP2381518.1 type II secretion system protein N [Nitrospirota bacterium]MDP3595836.1 type II secretion system protein N [Nitrospirota bacterium]